MRRIPDEARSVLLLIVSAMACGRSALWSTVSDADATGAGGTIGTSLGRDAAPATQSDGRPPDAQPPDPGRVAMHRLDKIEYDNTVKDLLGVTSSPASGFQDDQVDESPSGFDNVAENLSMSPERYLDDFNAAKTLADAVWSDATLKSRIITCAPDAQGKCARSIIAAFGLRAWRRPLTDGEVSSLGTFADGAVAATGDFQAGMKRVVTFMLSSLPFLYKIEADPDPRSTTPHPLTGYELASRLSYLLWSSMPDDALLALGDGLRQDAVLTAQFDRMLADPRANALTQNFAGQWLGMRDLAAHVVEPAAYPEWDEALRASMVGEMSLYFGDFLDRTFDGFVTADLHFVDARLGTHYQLADPPTGAQFERLDLQPATHTGFLGLAGFLTVTSLPYRTSPSTRGSWILEHLLCDGPSGSPHDGDPPSLDLAGVPADPRTALEQDLGGAACATCHETFDGMGFALEHYDGIGQLRADYSPTQPIDAAGILPDGTRFDGATALAATLARDPRLPACAARQALTYALGRVLDDDDRDRVANLVAAWQEGTVRDLLRAIVLSDAFRSRRGEAP
jgi:hypothetical protein